MKQILDVVIIGKPIWKCINTHKIAQSSVVPVAQVQSIISQDIQLIKHRDK